MRPVGFLLALLFSTSGFAAPLTLSRAEYLDRVNALWNAQIVAVMMTMPYEHATAAVTPIERLPMLWDGKPPTHAPVDDDWYYEMAAIRGFEKYGVGMTVAQLGEQWREDECGSWGSSHLARLNLQKGIQPPDCGHPRYNPLWFSIGPQFSADVYGALAPGLPNEAARLAREYGHINGYAEGVDGAVFMATMISIAFVETDPKAVVRQAAAALHPSSPYRQCIDQLIADAEGGQSFRAVVDRIEDRWHIEYPATNNAVPNGGIAAAGVWFGEGDFWKTITLVAQAADFTDADCNAANAAAVVGAMHGMKALPADRVAQLNDRIRGTGMGAVVKFKRPVDVSIHELAERTVAVGEQFLARSGAEQTASGWRIPAQPVRTQPAERFELAELTKWWAPEWTLERAGVGGAGGGMAGIRGNTHLNGDVLATYPRDEVRGCLLRRSVNLGPAPRLTFSAGADAGRAWQLEIYADNERLLQKVIEGGEKDRRFETIDLDLSRFAGRETVLRLYQRVLLPGKTAGNALWRAPTIADTGATR